MTPNLSMVNWLNCVWSSDLHPHAKYIACYLRRFMNDFHDMAWPSLPRIEKETGLSRPTVIKYLKLLESEGWILKDSTKHTSMTYIAVLPQSALEGVKELNPPSKGGLPQGVKEVYPNKQSNNQDNNNYVVAERQPKPSFDFEKVKSIWNEVCTASQIKTTKCNIVSEKAKRQLPKTYSKYCKVKKELGHEPAERHVWCKDYFSAVLDRASGFAGQEGEHSNWKPNLEYATRVNTYDQVMEWFYDKRS